MIYTTLSFFKRQVAQSITNRVPHWLVEVTWSAFREQRLPEAHRRKPEPTEVRMWGEKGRSHILYAHQVASVAHVHTQVSLFS